MRRNTEILEESLLLVEGEDEKKAFEAILGALVIRGVQVVPVGGTSGFADTFDALRNTPGFSSVQRLGFVRDAEGSDVESVFNGLRSLLMQKGFPVPDGPGRIQTTEGVTIGIFIMPNNRDRGMLEDLFLASINETAEERCVARFIGCIENIKSSEDFAKFKKSKARVQAFLAIKDPEARSLGIGAQKHLWDFDHVCFSELKTFLRALLV